MDYTNLKEKMEKAINTYNERLSEIRAGRANPAILNKVRIDYYGTQTVIRLTFPELTEERRKEIVKDVKKMAEEAKVAVRNVRREGIDKAKADQKAGDITEDELKGAENEIQKLTDKYVEEVDKIAEAKEKEVMSV